MLNLARTPAMAASHSPTTSPSSSGSCAARSTTRAGSAPIPARSPFCSPPPPPSNSPLQHYRGYSNGLQPQGRELRLPKILRPPSDARHRRRPARQRRRLRCSFSLCRRRRIGWFCIGLCSLCWARARFRPIFESFFFPLGPHEADSCK